MLLGGTGYGLPYPAVPAAMLGPHFSRAFCALGFGSPRRGRAEFGRWAKSNAVVMSPTVCLRHAVRFGTSTPKRFSMSRNCEVWSKVSRATSPPRL
ncbi:Uncharacterised protein [Mycobacteroides abscessus subsp. abscessus]|nr:Uncharacterised protein [Mycobacteroides abscessus subsp. abscessus]